MTREAANRTARKGKCSQPHGARLLKIDKA